MQSLCDLSHLVINKAVFINQVCAGLQPAYGTAQPQGNECLRVTRVRLAQLESDSRTTCK